MTDCPDPSLLLAYVEGAGPADLPDHLDECAACRAAVLAVSPGAPARLGPGSIVDRYILLERVGQGGMGVVWTAHDPELHRRVALKLIRTDVIQDGALRERLLREAQAMARLAHPNVVTVYDAGTFEGDVFVAMEWAPGGTLGAWLDAEKEKRPWRAIVRAFIEAGRGLAAAHDAGLVHRDFKPDNVLVGQDSRPRVTDFGLARPAGASDPAAPDDLVEQKITQTGVVVGTPAYMAPEQATGGTVDGRADQFSFAVALFEALHGERPFRATSERKLLAAILDGAITWPPRSPVSRRVRRALTRGLAAKAEDRFPSMNAFLDELAEPSRRRAAWIAVIAGTLAAATAVAIVATRTPRAPQLCTGLDTPLAGVWDAKARADLAAAGAPAWGLAPFDAYASELTSMRVDACRRHARGAESADLLDLKTGCLDQKTAALAQVVAVAKEHPSRADKAAGGLEPLGACGDADWLRQAERPPADPALRAKAQTDHAFVARARADALVDERGKDLDALQKLVDDPATFSDVAADGALAIATIKDGINPSDPPVRTALLRAIAMGLRVGRLDIAAEALTRMGDLDGLLKNPDAPSWFDLADGAAARSPDRDLLETQVWAARASVAAIHLDWKTAAAASRQELEHAKHLTLDTAYVPQAEGDLGYALSHSDDPAERAESWEHIRASLDAFAARGETQTGALARAHYHAAMVAWSLDRMPDYVTEARGCATLLEALGNHTAVACWELVADGLERSGDLDGATKIIADDEATIAKEPDVADILGVLDNVRAHVLLDRGDGAGALAIFSKEKDSTTRDLAARGRAELLAGKLDAARADLTTALAKSDEFNHAADRDAARAALASMH